MLANILVKYFEAGGPIIGPILITAIVAVAVVANASSGGGARASDAIRKRSRKCSPPRWENGDFREAGAHLKDSSDPISERSGTG